MSLLLSTISALAGLLPDGLVRALAAAGGRAWFHVLRYRRAVILSNLARAFPELDLRARLQLGKAACTHLVETLLEFLRIPRYARRGLGALLEVEGREHLDAALAKGKGVLCLTGHLGSFELVAGAIAERLGPGRVALVVKPFPPAVDRFVTRVRELTGLQVIRAHGGMKGILRALARGTCVVFVLDQNATRHIGVFVDFFGHPASTMSSLALIALRTEAPVIGVATFRRPDGRHVLHIGPEIPIEARETREETVRHMTQLYTRFIEDRIRAHPEQWLWTHRRWKTQPEVSTPASSEAGGAP